MSIASTMITKIITATTKKGGQGKVSGEEWNYLASSDEGEWN